jgi:hypothetical protein
MNFAREPYLVSKQKVILDYSKIQGNFTFSFISKLLADSKKSEMADFLVTLFRLLSSHTAEEIVSMNDNYSDILSDKEKNA